MDNRVKKKFSSIKTVDLRFLKCQRVDVFMYKRLSELIHFIYSAGKQFDLGTRHKSSKIKSRPVPHCLAVR